MAPRRPRIGMTQVGRGSHCRGDSNLARKINFRSPPAGRQGAPAGGQLPPGEPGGEGPETTRDRGNSRRDRLKTPGRRLFPALPGAVRAGTGVTQTLWK